MSHLKFKYVRIQGKELAKNTMYAKGIFSMCWFAHELPWPEPCRRQEPVVCWFKTENSEEMMKMIRPALWLLERYHHPYYLVYTNDPGEIVYEDKYQIATRVDGYLPIEEQQPTWTPADDELDENGLKK